MSLPGFATFLADRYPKIKAIHPDEGRRKWKLRAIEEFWGLTPEQRVAYTQNNDTQPHVDHSFDADPDRMDDEIGNEAHGSGILLRTDYSDEQAWQSFLEKLHENELEFSSFATMEPEEEPEEEEDDSSDSQDEEMDDDRDSTSESTRPGGTNHPDQDEEMEENGPGNDEELHPPIFCIINPPETSFLRSLFTSISNLGSLRLLNDVDIRHAPLPPQGTKRIKPPHRLIDKDGLQEIYRGKRIWIYDLRSNRDQSVRVVGQQGDVYGTATDLVSNSLNYNLRFGNPHSSADSWRARVSHICELQVNLASGAMKIDFGGLDKYEYHERVRNLTESEFAAG